MSATFVGMPAFPDGGPGGAGRHPAAAQPRARHHHHPRQAGARGASAEVGATGSSCGWPGRAIKDDTRCADLDRHLLQLEASLTARRRDRALGPRRRRGLRGSSPRSSAGHGVDEVVKVKSMATQEIGLNEALAAEGIAAWETDLAELIVQLGDDLPSHILVPAIHRNRAEIREIFLRRDGGCGPARPRRPDRRAGRARRRGPRCTCARSSCARRSAISGANFAVAETGTLVVVESEGNGRMCLTLPEVLVSWSASRRCVPTWHGPRRRSCSCCRARRPASG